MSYTCEHGCPECPKLQAEVGRLKKTLIEWEQDTTTRDVLSEAADLRAKLERLREILDTASNHNRRAESTIAKIRVELERE